MHYPLRFKLAVALVFLLLSNFTPPVTRAASLLNNGSFETGDFSGWTVTNQDGGSGSWFLTSGTTTPLSSDTVAGAAAGLFYAVTDNSRPGAHSLTQSFTVPATAGFVELSFRLFADNYGGRNPTGSLDYASGMPNQHARVDLLTSGASAFDTNASAVISNFYLGSDIGATPNPYGFYRFNISSLVTPGGAYQLRFADVANQSQLHMGVDAVNIIAEVPEPATYAFFAAGLGLLLGVASRTRKPAA